MHDDSTGWLELLSDGRRAKLLDEMRTAKDKDGFVSAIVFTQLSDKATIIRQRKLTTGSGKQLRRDFDAIRDLRDNVARSNYYAETPEDARQVCEVVRKILRIQEDLLAGINDQ